MPVHKLSPSGVLQRLNPIDGPLDTENIGRKCEAGTHASVRFWDWVRFVFRENVGRTQPDPRRGYPGPRHQRFGFVS